MIQVGDLYRVIVNDHIDWQLGDLIMVTQLMPWGGAYVEGINIKTGNRHHYRKENLEKL